MNSGYGFDSDGTINAKIGTAFVGGEKRKSVFDFEE